MYQVVHRSTEGDTLQSYLARAFRPHTDPQTLFRRLQTHTISSRQLYRGSILLQDFRIKSRQIQYHSRFYSRDIYAPNFACFAPILSRQPGLGVTFTLPHNSMFGTICIQETSIYQAFKTPPKHHPAHLFNCVPPHRTGPSYTIILCMHSRLGHLSYDAPSCRNWCATILYMLVLVVMTNLLIFLSAASEHPKRTPTHRITHCCSTIPHANISS